jgi:hypothetical protein
MPMPPYAVICYTPNCGALAAFKIAATWSDGNTSEHKTYSLCCESCLPKQYADAKRRQANCRLTLGESLGVPQIFDYSRTAIDRTLTRRAELET